MLRFDGVREDALSVADLEAGAESAITYHSDEEYRRLARARTAYLTEKETADGSLGLLERKPFPGPLRVAAGPSVPQQAVWGPPPRPSPLLGLPRGWNCWTPK